MSFDLYENENLDAVSSMAPVQDVPAGFFDGFGKVPQLAMRSAAVAGRATSLLASAPLVLLDRIKGDTDLEDRYFKQHEDVFQRAVDYWTPKPNEVGTAAQVVGDMLFTLPTAIAAPPIALGSAYAGTAEDLVRQGVEPGKAQAVGAVQAVGFATGLWMPILGKNLWQRAVVGGAGFNALQGTVMRGLSGEILEGTSAEGQFKAFDGEALTLDVLMGLGFGTFAHLSPEQRAQGEEVWNKISEWAQNLSPTQKDAIATLREAQHLNVDSTPGKPVDPSDIEAHVNRMRTAIDQMVNDQPVQVSDLPEPKMTPNPEREAQAMEQASAMKYMAEQVRQDEGLPEVSQVGRTITERLMELGTPAQEAADKGLLWDSFFKTMEARTGQPADELMGRYFDRVFKAEDVPEGVMGQGKAYGFDQIQTPEFKAWSGDAPFVPKEEANTKTFKTGEPVVVEAYHGTSRPDRVGETFKKSRATSGPMAFHTSNPELASGYAQGKNDTSLALEDQNYSNWFKFKPKGERSPIDIERAWHRLDPETKAKIEEIAPTLRNDEDGNVISEPGNTSGNGSYDYNLSKTRRGYDKRGNPLKALVEDWLNSGVLFNDEEKFMQVLQQAGFPVKDVTYDSPHAQYPFVYKNFIRMKNPLVTDDIPQSVFDALNAAAKRDRSRAQQYGADMWDKNTKTLKEWVQFLNDPSTQQHAWTSIPDKVTKILKELGYDGIIDESGKNGGEKHPVYIPFEENQVKSAIGNKGKFGQTSNILKQSANDQTNTPAFRKWFGDSKVVDSDGKPLVVYHGTGTNYSRKGEYLSGDFDTFDPALSGKSSMTGAPEGTFFFTNDPAVASSYTVKFRGEWTETLKDNANVMPVYVSLKNPLKVNAKGESWREVLYKGEYLDVNEIAALAKDSGKYDGVIITRVKDHGVGATNGKPSNTYIAFHPEQIKSAISNRGTFDPNDPNILHQGSRGFLQLGSRMSIGLLSSADKSTFLHESGHFFLEVMNDLSKEVPDLRADMDTVREWMGIKGDTAEARAEAWNAMSLEEKRPYHEQWARGFEQYLMDGKAPNEQLKGAFERFRDWLIEIYKSATALNVKVTDQVRQVMDRMLDSQAKAAQEPNGDVVPPPRAIVGEAPGSDLDKVLADGMPNLENHKPLSDPDIQGMVQDMALNEAGWAEKGGFLLRSGSEVAGEEQISRTKWVPKAEWWPDRPAQGKRRLNEAQIQEAVRKAIAGEPLKPLEQSTVDYMTAIANDRNQGVDQIGWEEFGRAMDDVIAHGEEPTTENVFDYEAMVRAIELNPEAAKSAQEAYDIHNDDAMFMAEIRSIIDEKVQQATQSVPGSDGEGGAEPAKPAEQPDPITAEAARIAQSSPDVRIEVGTDESGQPITKSIQEYLDDAKAGADQARKDVSLIQAAAECLLGSL